MKKGLAIFDMDETLVKSDFAWALSGGRYLDKLGLVHDKDIENAFYEHGVAYVISILQNVCKINKPEDELFEALTEETLYDYQHNVFLKDLATETVLLFRDSGYFTCVLSANSPRALEIVKNRFSSELPMDAWFSTRLLSYTKGNPQVYDLISGYFGLKPSDCILFDDAIYSIKTAVCMGMKCFWISDKNCHFDDSSEILRLCSFKDVMPKIKEIIN